MARRQAVLRVSRFDPGHDAEPHWEDHPIDVTPGMTVLDALWQVKEQAPTLAWRSSCRMGICGSCGMLINGRPRLACNTQLSELGIGRRQRRAAAQLRHRQGPGARFAADVRRPTASCSPTSSATTPTSRKTRLASIARRRTSSSATCSSATASSAAAASPPARPSPRTTFTPGPCHSPRRTGTTATRATAGSRRGSRFSRRVQGRGAATSPASARMVCPKGVDPAKAIQLMKRDLVFDLLRLRRKQAPARRRTVAPVPKRRRGIREAPARTVPPGRP